MIDIIHDPVSKIQLGALPPPLGGVSVYLYRLKKLRPQDSFFDLQKLTWWQKIKLVALANREIVIHGECWKVIFLCYLFRIMHCNSYSIVLHGQGWLVDYEKINVFWRWVIKIGLQNAKTIQVVAEHIKDTLLMKFPQLEGKVFVKNAYLPPPLDEGEYIWNSYGNEVREFVKKHTPLIVANAFQLNEWIDGTDLYGLDMCVDLMKRLKEDYPKAGLLFALSDDKFRHGYYEKINQIIRDDGLTEQIYFLTDSHELWPIFRHAKIMVRPTCTDGFSVSIQEARMLGCRVVASDVCERPDDVVVFSNRDINDFELKVRRMLNED